MSVAREAAQHGDPFVVRVACELAEDAVLLKRARESDHEAILAPFDHLFASANVPADEKVYVRHHKAKALKRLGRHREAVDLLEEILSEQDAADGPPVVRLLLARTLTELPKGVVISGSGERARELLLGLLDEAEEGDSRVSGSVTLAAAELLRRGAAGIDVAAVLPQYASLLEARIIGAARRGLAQGSLAFGALATAWRRMDADAFWRIFNVLPLPSADRHDVGPDERSSMTAWGEILVVAAEHESTRRQALLEASLDFFEASDTPYGRIHAAKVLIRLGRAGEAIAALESVLKMDLKPTDRAWAFRWLAEAHRELGDTRQAHEAACLAVESLPSGNSYARDFLRYRDELAASVPLRDD
jgi:tetratricopeptide (TPR) repeat protein